MKIVELSTEEIAFFRFSGDLYFADESPLAFIEKKKIIPKSFKKVSASLIAKSYIKAEDWRADERLLNRINVVAECDAHVQLIYRHKKQRKKRDFYVYDNYMVEYQRHAHMHRFLPVRSESTFVAELAQQLTAASQEEKAQEFVFDDGEFLTFAILARDARGETAHEHERMSDAELRQKLAELDDEGDELDWKRESKQWSEQLKSLHRKGYVVRGKQRQPQLVPELQSLSVNLSTSRQNNYTRHDFIDEEWLSRNLVLFPAPHAVIQINSSATGEIVLTRLDSILLAERLTDVISELPELEDFDLAERSVTDLLLKRV